MWTLIGPFLERPSNRARASERFDLRTRVETVEEVTFVAIEMWRIAVSGAGVRDMVRDGVGGRGSSRAGMGTKDGRRGGADFIEEGVGFGSSGRVIEGAGLGDGMDLKESREKRKRRDGALDGSGILLERTVDKVYKEEEKKKKKGY